MTDLRTAYATALLRRLEEHAGPLADVVPLLDRLDVLTGLDMEQKRLSAGVGPEIEGVPPVIEHGSDHDGSSVREALEAAPRPEEPQQAPVSVSGGVAAYSPGTGGDPAVAPTSTTPAASSQEAIPTEPYTAPSTAGRVPCIDCGRPSSVGKDRCQSCAQKITWTPERRAAQAKRIADRRAAGTERFVPSDARNTVLDAATNGATNHFVDADKKVDDAPARGLAAVIVKPLVAGLTGGSASAPCSCPDWWKEKMASFQEDGANESHHETCGRYRKGAHRWPMPVQGVEGDEPFTVQCKWCGETREVDRLGVPWVVSEKNPANGGKVPA